MPVDQCPNCGCNLKKFEPISYGNVEVDVQGEIVFEGQSVQIAKTQREIVEALIYARGRYLTRAVLANLLDGEINDSSVSKYIERARIAFRAIDPSFSQIESIRGYGAYKWRLSNDGSVRANASAGKDLGAWACLSPKVQQPPCTTSTPLPR